MKLAPYDLPLQPGFRSKGFEKSTLRWKPLIERCLFKEKNFRKGLRDPWVSYQPSIKNDSGAGRSLRWTPKLYACLGAASYWPTLLRLIKGSRRFGVSWKFYMAPDGYQRPDKIVFYFDSSERLKRFVRKLRPLLPKRGFHEMRHVASTAQMGIETKSRKGLYVGMDPPLGVSWRYYRCFCAAWAELNKDYLESLPKGSKGWFERMSLSTEHEGPSGLSADPKNIAHVRRFWKEIHRP